MPESLPSATYLRHLPPYILGQQQQNAGENRSTSKGCKEGKTPGGGVRVNGPLPKWESGCKQRLRENRESAFHRSNPGKSYATTFLHAKH